MHTRFTQRSKSHYRKPLKKSETLSLSAEGLEELTYANQDFQKLILQLVITYRILTWTIPTETQIYSKVTELYNLHCLQMIRRGLNTHRPCLRQEAKSILTKTIRALITQLTENDMTNQVWMTQLLAHFYKNTNQRKTIKNYFYHTPYISLTLEIEKVYNARVTEIKDRFQYREHRSSLALKKAIKKSDSMIKRARDIRRSLRGIYSSSCQLYE